MKTGVIVARFQVPYLHAGHIHLIDEVREKSDQVLICLGEPNVPDIRNPLPFVIRVDMIMGYIGKDKNYHFRRIIDHRDDKLWSEHLDLILDEFPNPTLYGSRDCFSKFYIGKYPFREIPEIPSKYGTEIREDIEIHNTLEYREGIIHGVIHVLENQRHAKEQQEENPYQK